MTFRHQSSFRQRTQFNFALSAQSWAHPWAAIAGAVLLAGCSAEPTASPGPAVVSTGGTQQTGTSGSVGGSTAGGNSSGQTSAGGNSTSQPGVGGNNPSAGGTTAGSTGGSSQGVTGGAPGTTTGGTPSTNTGGSASGNGGTTGTKATGGNSGTTGTKATGGTTSSSTSSTATNPTGGSSSSTVGGGSAVGGTSAAANTNTTLRAGLLYVDYCLPECLSSTATDENHGCGNEDGADCLVPGSELTANTTACDPATAAAPPTGDGYRMGCKCIRPCDSADSDALDNTPGDGWGWEYGTNCMVVGSTAVEGKASCVAPPIPTGDGYLVKGEDGLERCVPACEHPEFQDDPDGWGYEKRQSCIVTGSKAESQVAKCELVASTPLVAPGDGYLLMAGDPAVETCVPPCKTTTSADATDGWGWEQERTCIVPGTKPSVQGLPCVPPPADVTGSCPDPITCPVVDGSTINCGCMWVDGFAERKKTIMDAIKAAGTQSFGNYFLASAMMETNNLKTDYPRGDNKGGDASCWGLCKQNLGMIRQCYSSISSESQAATMNSDLSLDIKVYNACRAKFGNNWWSAHRMGANNQGLNTHDTRVFKAAQDWTYEMLQEGSGHLSDDVRFWVDVPAI